MTSLFDNTTDAIASAEDWGDHSRVVRGERILRRFSGPKHHERALEFVQAYTEGWLAATESNAASDKNFS